MTGYLRPAAYIRVARGCPLDAVTTQEHAIYQAARRHGWPEPAVYVDVGATDGQQPGPALARLTAAVATGRHDALLLGGIGTICRDPRDLMTLLARCARHGVAVECVTTLLPAAAADPGRR